MDSIKNLWIGLIVVGLIAIGGYAFPSVQKAIGLGASADCSTTTCLAGGLSITSGVLEANGTFKVGTSGTAQVNQISTTCSMTANVSITATSTGYTFCTGVTGVTSADNIQAIFASSTGAISTANKDNWVITSAKASTTAGVIDFVLLNMTGIAAVPSAGSRIGSTTAIFASH